MGSKKRRVKTAIERDELKAVKLYARIRELKDEAKALEKEARDLAMDLYEGHGLTALSGPEGVVAITYCNGSTRLDPKKVREILTKEQIEEVSVVGDPTLRINFTPKKEKAA